MKKYLIALDLDGTLLDENSQIPQRTAAYLMSLQDLGHKIVLATGRPYRATLEYHQTLKLNTPLITDNGAYISSENEKGFQVHHQTIKKETINTIFRFAEKHIVTAFYSVFDNFYSYRPQERLRFYFHLLENTKIYEGPLDCSSLPEPFVFMIAVKKDFDLEFEDFILNKSENVLFRCWGKDANNAVYELYPKKASKGNALMLIADYYGIKRDKTIAFGDGRNDYDLLKASGLGVKMINGSKLLDEVADDTTLKNNKDQGIMDYLKKFFNH